jgi:sortase A
VGLSVILDEGTDGPTLRRAVGHLEGTPFPGEPGNVVLAGHRDSLFRPLEGVRAGDRMRVTTLDGTFDYEVSSVVIVPPDRTDLLAPDPSGAREVTLVTCYPFYYVGPAPLRYIVRGVQLDESSRTKGEEPAGRGGGDSSPRAGRELQ